MPPRMCPLTNPWASGAVPVVRMRTRRPGVLGNYGRNNAGAVQTIRVLMWQMAQSNGSAQHFRGFAEQ